MNQFGIQKLLGALIVVLGALLTLFVFGNSKAPERIALFQPSADPELKSPASFSPELQLDAELGSSPGSNNSNALTLPPVAATIRQANFLSEAIDREPLVLPDIENAETGLLSREDLAEQNSNQPMLAAPEFPAAKRLVRSESPKTKVDSQRELAKPRQVSGTLHRVADPEPDLPILEPATAPESLAIPESSPPVSKSASSRPVSGVRKANWAEIEMASSVDSQQGTVFVAAAKLPRLKVNPHVEIRAREHIRYGESLARRRSFFAAREEFILALLTISSSHQSESVENEYADRLARALTALDEIGDFANAKHERERFRYAVLSHQTRLVDESDIEATSASKARDLYCGFAQSQIEQAVGYSVAGSEALHALGKLESRSSGVNSKATATSRARALVFYRAAMNVNASNSVCANDLGVLLFNMGRLEDAQEALRASLGASQSQLTWSNLASVHTQRALSASSGKERDRQLYLANLAQREVNKTNPGRAPASSDWASASEFQDNAAFPDTTIEPVSGAIGNPSALQSQADAASLIRKVTGWN